MIKRLFIPLLLLISFVANSQTAMTNPNALALDTVTQAAAEGPTIRITSYQSSVSTSMLITKISGTIAGTVTLQGTNKLTDGWQNITAAANDQVTFTLTDATQSVVLSQSPKRFLYYRVSINPTGTWSASYSATAYTTKQ